MSERVRVSIESFVVPSEGWNDETGNNSVEVATNPSVGSAFVLSDTPQESALAKLWTSLLSRSFVESGVDRLTGHLDGYSLQQASWAAAVAKLLDGESTIDPLAETGALAGLAGIRVRSDGRWSAAWAGGCRIILIQDDETEKARFCTDPQPFDSPTLNSLSEAQLPLNSSQGTVVPGETFILVDSSSAQWALETIRSSGLWSSHAGLAGLVAKSRLDGNVGSGPLTMVVGRVDAA